ncbi:hypothetical protein [Nonomuraea sp. B1E8]|uniref:hypothetical protein n=1 Tax=unclassified Nonomuraea TaxID=2593643 RepID=UPI00325F42DD
MPDLVGAVLLTSAVAAGVLVKSRGCAWGRYTSHPPDQAGAFAVPRAGSPTTPRRGRANAAGLPAEAATPVAEHRRRATALAATGTEAVRGGEIGVTGATVLIDRPFLRPAPRHASVRVAVSPAAVLLAATALVRVAVASGRETEPRSPRAAEEGPAISRRLLTRSRAERVRSAGRRPDRRRDSRHVPSQGHRPATDRSDHAHR